MLCFSQFIPKSPKISVALTPQGSRVAPSVFRKTNTRQYYPKKIANSKKLSRLHHGRVGSSFAFASLYENIQIHYYL